MSARPTDADQLATLVRRLTARDRWLLAMLGEHTVLTTSHLHKLGWGRSLRAVQARARTLHRAGVLDRFQPGRDRGEGSTPLHLILGPLGARVLAAETGHRLAEIGYRGRADALTSAHRITLAHDVGATDLVCDLAAAPSGVTLRQWWSAARCRRCFHHARPDAYLTLTTTPKPAPRPSPEEPGRGSPGLVPARGWWEMFLEYDTGTENLARVAGKLDGFHTLAATSGIITPVGFWFTRTGREHHARHALAEALHALPHPHLVPVLTAAPHTHTGAAGEVGVSAVGRAWLPLHPDRPILERVSLAALAAAQTRPATRSDRPGRSRDTSTLTAPPPLPPPLPARRPRPGPGAASVPGAPQRVPR